MLDKIKKIIKEDYNRLVSIRRDIHSHPERGRNEYRTQELIIKELEKLKTFKIVKSANTGVVALIKGTKNESNQKCVGLRADIDALGIEDMKDVEYKSQNKGVCHACGHDVHTTILLGVAKVLSEMQNEFSGCVKLFFQPDEEDEGGAEIMIREGHMNNPKVDIMLGIHVSDNYSVGEVRFCYDTMQASSDEMKIVVKGVSSHAAHPENGVDAILIACQIVNNLQSIASRNVSPTDSIALSLGKIYGGTIVNALAEEVVIEGTLRTLNKDTRNYVLNRMKSMCEYIASSYGGKATVTISPSYPPLINNKDMVDYVKETASLCFEKNNIIVK